MRNVSQYLANQSFLQLPRWMTDGRYDLYEQLLYTQILDIAKLSEQNGYADEKGVYVFLSLQQVQKLLGCSQGKAVKTLRSLEERGLLHRKQQGAMKPNLYYPTPPDYQPGNSVSANEPKPVPKEAAVIPPRASPAAPTFWDTPPRQSFHQSWQDSSSTIDHNALSIENYKPPF